MLHTSYLNKSFEFLLSTKCQLFPTVFIIVEIILLPFSLSMTFERFYRCSNRLELSHFHLNVYCEHVESLNCHTGKLFSIIILSCLHTLFKISDRPEWSIQNSSSVLIILFNIIISSLPFIFFMLGLSEYRKLASRKWKMEIMGFFFYVKTSKLIYTFFDFSS